MCCGKPAQGQAEAVKGSEGQLTSWLYLLHDFDDPTSGDGGAIIGFKPRPFIFSHVSALLILPVLVLLLGELAPSGP